MRRLILILLVAAGLAPGTWVRSPAAPPNMTDGLTLSRLPVAEQRIGALEFLGAWQLESRNDHFGGYSALIARRNGSLLAASDRGRMLVLSAPDGREPISFKFDYFAGLRTDAKRMVDIEALTQDHSTGRIWAAYEGRNQIERLERDFTGSRLVRPVEMRSWRGNSGPEAMARLTDGRMIVLAEASRRWFARTTPALLFAGDPVEGVRPLQFRFVPPAGYSPTDMAQLPDGRVLILLRSFRLGVPPSFPGKLVIADPAAIRAGREWSGTEIADLKPPLPNDNFEGLALQPQADGSTTIWVISDDNRVVFQRTLLLKLRLPPTQKARGLAARLRESP